MEADHKAARALATKEPIEIAVTPRGLTVASPELEGEDRIRLLDYWRSIRKRIWMIAGISTLVTAIAAIYMARKPDIYQAQALVQIDLEDLNPALSGATKNNSVIVNNQINDPTYFNTQLRILTSPGLLRRVVKTLDLEHNDSFNNPEAANQRSTWQNLLRMFGLSSNAKEKVKEKAKEEEDKNKLPGIL
jgi:Uncharacterized protein involved in exopolysaccharide biosynthesis